MLFVHLVNDAATRSGAGLTHESSGGSGRTDVRCARVSSAAEMRQFSKGAVRWLGDRRTVPEVFGMVLACGAIDMATYSRI